MSRFTSIFLALWLPLASGWGCTYSVISSRTETREADSRLLDSREAYTVDSQSWTGDRLVLTLNRECWASREVEQETVVIETRDRNMFWGWIGVASVASLGFVVFFPLYFVAQSTIDFGGDICFEDTPEECDAQEAQDIADAEDQQDLAVAIFVGSLIAAAAGAVAILIFDDETYESERVTDRGVYREAMRPSQCYTPWPQGQGALWASSGGGEYSALASGNGRVEVDLGDAPLSFWSSEAPVRLELPGLPERLSFALDPDLRQAAVDGASAGDVQLSLRFDDRDGDGDGLLDAGEFALLLYDVANRGDAPLSGLALEVRARDAGDIEVGSPVQLGDLAPGQSARGQIHVTTHSDLADTVIFEGQIQTATGTAARDQLQVATDVRRGPQRAYVWYNESDHRGLLATGSVRLQTVLTDTGRYAFVADAGTRERISDIVEQGGGSVEDRLRSAIEAANAENIRSVFELSINPVAGNHVQIVLAVYDTANADRVFLRDAAVDSSDALQVLEAFDRLAQGYVEWAGRSSRN